jgi:hypothetical protein
VASLTLKYEHNSDPNDDFGWLAMSVATEMMQGEGGMWVQWQDVKEFAESLDVFPLSDGEFRELDRGYGQQNDYHSVVKVRIEPKNVKGDLVVTARLSDSDDPEQHLQTKFVCHYASVSLFRDALLAVVDRTRDKAILEGR